mmetsp:Transcript_25546/g.47143  ORF Transcript_25546/g.47143 Transcript_25546/m.47143 type:complete len:208 (-) Transcript_25546:79-702(-)
MRVAVGPTVWCHLHSDCTWTGITLPQTSQVLTTFKTNQLITCHAGEIMARFGFFSGPGRRWIVGCRLEEGLFKSSSGDICSEAHCGRMPHQIGIPWSRKAGLSFVVDGSIRVLEGPPLIINVTAMRAATSMSLRCRSLSGKEVAVVDLASQDEIAVLTVEECASHIAEHAGVPKNAIRLLLPDGTMLAESDGKKVFVELLEPALGGA